MDIKMQDNTQKVLSAFEKQLQNALNAIGLKAEGYAKKDCPVDTGRLRNSITYATENYSGAGTYTDKDRNSYSDATARGTPKKYDVYIGTNVEYAKRIETKDNLKHATGKAHFLRDAAARHAKEYRKIVETALKN